MAMELALLLVSGCVPVLRIDQSPVPPIQRTGAAFDSAGCFSAEPTPEECAEPPCASVPPPPEFFQKLSGDVVEQAIRSFQERRNLPGPAADAAWPPFLETLDAYLAQSPEHLRLSPLIRARVAAEFELDQEQRKPGGADPALTKVVFAFIARLDRQVRAQHALVSGRT